MNINDFTTKRTGRSIEETIVRRKFDSTNPITWPEVVNNNIHQQPLLSSRTSNVNNLNQQHVGNHSNVKLMSQSLNINLTNTAKEREINSKLANALSEYSEADKMNMMESLVRYTRTLQNRVQELEGHIARNGNSKFAIKKNLANTDSNYQGHIAMANTIGSETTLLRSKSSSNNHPNSNNNSNPNNNINRNNGPAFLNRPGSGINKSISDIDHRILSLKELFRNGDPIAERHAASTKICAVVRGYILREKHLKYQKGIREWKWLRCRPVTFLLDILLAKHAKRDAGLYLLKVNRNMKFLLEIFSKWASIYRKNAPLRRMVKRLAEEKITFKKYQFLKLIFNNLKAVSVGELSTRKANAVRRKMIEEIRKDLSKQFLARGLLGVVPDSEILKALGKKVIETFKASQRLLKMKYVYNSFLKIRDRARLHSKQAVKHHFKVLVGLYFYAWSDHIYLVARGLDRKRWPGPRKYEVKYNQKRVDNFRNSVCKRTIFKAWKDYFGIQLRVKSMYQRKLSMFLYEIFHVWAEISHKQHKIRWNTYENWKEYPRVMMTKPFNAWARMVIASKNRMNEQIRICNSYVRWKWRARIIRIMKVWRHQALYGRIDGLYSRQMLLKTLAEQKFAGNTLQKLMADQTIELEECRSIADTEINKRKKLEEELHQANQVLNKNKMTFHHFEEELRRVESVIAAMQLINPNQMNHIRKKQVEFKFKERSLISNEDQLPSTDADNRPSLATLSLQQQQELNSNNNNQINNNVMIDTTISTPSIIETESLKDTTSKSKMEEVSVSSNVDQHLPSILEEKSILSVPENEDNKLSVNTTSEQITKSKIVEETTIENDDLFNKTKDEEAGEDNTTDIPVKENDISKSVVYNSYLEDRDKVLLLRVKWLTDRFQNTKAILEKTAHQKTSLDLIVDNSNSNNQPSSPSLSVSVSAVNSITDSPNQNSPGKNKMAVISELDGETNSISSSVISDSKTVAFTLAERPSLLPVTTMSQQQHSINNLTLANSTVLPLSKQDTTDISLMDENTMKESKQVNNITRQPSKNILNENNLSSLSRASSPGAIMARQGSIRKLSRKNTKKFKRGDTSQSMRSMNDSGSDLDTEDDMEYDLDEDIRLNDEIDVLKNAAVKILLSTIEFLENGDISTFQYDDKRHWAQYLLHSADAISIGHQQNITSSELQSSSDIMPLDMNKKITTTTTTSETSELLNKLDSTSILFEENEGNGVTWGTKLMEIRSMFPDAGNYSGKTGSALDDPNDINMFKRILEMRKNLNNIIDLQTKKYQRQLSDMLKHSKKDLNKIQNNTNQSGIGISTTNTALAIENNNTTNNVSIYSSNLKNYIDD